MIIFWSKLGTPLIEQALRPGLHQLETNGATLRKICTLRNFTSNLPKPRFDFLLFLLFVICEDRIFRPDLTEIFVAEIVLPEATLETASDDMLKLPLSLITHGYSLNFL